MPIFKSYADTVAHTMVTTVGEPIVLFEQPVEDGDESFEITGIFDEIITQNSDASIDVLIQQPNVIFRDNDVEAIQPKRLLQSRTLSRKGWQMVRPFTGRRYEISDINRDETTTTQYLLREV